MDQGWAGFSRSIPRYFRKRPPAGICRFRRLQKVPHALRFLILVAVPRYLGRRGSTVELHPPGQAAIFFAVLRNHNGRFRSLFCKSRAEWPQWAAQLGKPASRELHEVRMNQHSSGIRVRLLSKSTLLPCFDVAHSGRSYPATLLIREYARKRG